MRDAATIRIALAVGDIDGMDAGDIKYGEGDQGGWYCAGTSVVVAEAEDGAKVFEGYVCKMSPSPVLIK